MKNIGIKYIYWMVVKMKKVTEITLLAIAIIMMSLSTFAANKQIDWFIKPIGDNKQPLLMNGGSIYPEYNVRAIGKPDQKVIYLTFDAGYENGNVEKVLDTLKKHNVKATFFILAAIIKYSPDTVKRMIDEGHIIANHTANHKSITNMTCEELQANLKALEDYFEENTGARLSKFFRPPEGSFSVENLKDLYELGYKTVFWSFAYADWDNNKQMGQQKAIEKILSNTHNGMVMLLHPNSATNAAILDEVITKLLEQGYTFGTINQLYE